MTTSSSADTIAAIATAPGEAGIAIVRISGADALPIADKIFGGTGSPPSRQSPGTFQHGRVCAPRSVSPSANGHALDEVILLVYHAPRSYTCEDIVEIQGHGGRAAAGRVLQSVLDAGARLAEPGEFTRRAFLNGRLDLLQAEAVLDLIQSRSNRAAAAAMEQMDGRLSVLFNMVYDSSLEIAADLESTLDFSHEELPPTVLPDIRRRIQRVQEQMRELLATWAEGHLLREGALVVIAGKTNVGKSTLMNALLRSNRAIVSDIPGTTRDTLEEGMLIDGIPIRLVDTAGLRITECPIEQEGIERAQSYIERADILIYLVDASQPFDSWDREQLERLDSSSAVILLNKTDLGVKVDEKDLNFGVPSLSCSLLSGELPAGVIDTIRSRLAECTSPDPHAVISERHRRILLESSERISEALSLTESGDEERAVLAATTLRDALEILGRATGRHYHSELLDSIFSRFCVGK